MQCEKCGTELQDGKLYCENCGHGVQIVPDYNPELEERIARTLEKIVHEEFGNYRGNHGNSTNNLQIEKKKAVGLISILGIVILVIGILVGTHIKHMNSYEYQFTKAVKYAQKSQVDEAMEFYEKALELDKSSNDICVALADIFKQQKKYGIAEECLKTAIEREPSNIEVYRKLIEIFKTTENTAGITEVLESCENEDIQVAFAAYKLSKPSVNLEEGTYKSSLTLELKVDTKETIYYTIDGSEPTLNSTVYRKPVTLEEGEYTLRAIAVNAKGMVSEEIQKRYNIQLEIPSAASVFPDSGVYQEPNDILIEAPVGNTVYYTLDGSIPTKNSRKYTKPFPMRLGTFTLNCVVYGMNGKVSNITTKEYTLDLNTSYEAPEAITAVRNMMINTGEIYDFEGHALGMEGN